MKEREREAAVGGRRGERERDAETASRLVEDKMKRWLKGETGRCGRGEGEGGRGVGGRLKRGMKRQTAADEIHNLDPMRSLYLV